MSMVPLMAPSMIPPVALPPFSGRQPTSSPPTREAAVWRTPKPFQPSAIAPQSTAIFAAAAITSAPSGAPSAAGPTMTIGRSALARISPNAPRSDRDCVPAPM